MRTALSSWYKAANGNAKPKTVFKELSDAPPNRRSPQPDMDLAGSRAVAEASDLGRHGPPGHGVGLDIHGEHFRRASHPHAAILDTRSNSSMFLPNGYAEHEGASEGEDVPLARRPHGQDGPQPWDEQPGRSAAPAKEPQPPRPRPSSKNHAHEASAPGGSKKRKASHEERLLQEPVNGHHESSPHAEHHKQGEPVPGMSQPKKKKAKPVSHAWQGDEEEHPVHVQGQKLHPHHQKHRHHGHQQHEEEEDHHGLQHHPSHHPKHHQHQHHQHHQHQHEDHPHRLEAEPPVGEAEAKKPAKRSAKKKPPTDQDAAPAAKKGAKQEPRAASAAPAKKKAAKASAARGASGPDTAAGAHLALANPASLAVKKGFEACQLGKEVIHLPVEMFSMKDPRIVFSVETWFNEFTDEDRAALAKFLPRGTKDPLEVVEDLFESPDLNFGSPLQDFWKGLRAGRFNPRLAPLVESFRQLVKKQHYQELREYHENMVGKFEAMREVWGSLSTSSSINTKLKEWRVNGPRVLATRKQEAAAAAAAALAASTAAAPRSAAVPQLAVPGPLKGIKAALASAGKLLVKAPGEAESVPSGLAQRLAGLEKQLSKAKAALKAGAASGSAAAGALSKISPGGAPGPSPGHAKVSPPSKSSAGSGAKAPPPAKEQPSGHDLGFSLPSFLEAVAKAMHDMCQDENPREGGIPGAEGQLWWPTPKVFLEVSRAQGRSDAFRSRRFRPQELVSTALRVLSSRAPPGTKLWKPFIASRKQGTQWTWSGGSSEDEEPGQFTWAVSEKALAKLESRFREYLVASEAEDEALFAEGAFGPSDGGEPLTPGSDAGNEESPGPYPRGGAPGRGHSRGVKREELPDYDSDGAPMGRRGSGGPFERNHDGSEVTPKKRKGSQKASAVEQHHAGQGEDVPPSKGKHRSAERPSSQEEEEQPDSQGDVVEEYVPPEDDVEALDATEELASYAATGTGGLPPITDTILALFHKEERLRYANPTRCFRYTAADGAKSMVAPVVRVGGRIIAKVRDHSLLQPDRPPGATILSLVRDAMARLPGSQGTRNDVGTLLRCSQYLAYNPTDSQLNQIVSGAMDRLHYERDPCVRFDSERKMWLYLHRHRRAEDFPPDGIMSRRLPSSARRKDGEDDAGEAEDKGDGSLPDEEEFDGMGGGEDLPIGGSKKGESKAQPQGGKAGLSSGKASRLAKAPIMEDGFGDEEGEEEEDERPKKKVKKVGSVKGAAGQAQKLSAPQPLAGAKGAGDSAGKKGSKAGSRDRGVRHQDEDVEELEDYDVHPSRHPPVKPKASQPQAKAQRPKSRGQKHRAAEEDDDPPADSGRGRGNAPDDADTVRLLQGQLSALQKQLGEVQGQLAQVVQAKVRMPDASRSMSPADSPQKASYPRGGGAPGAPADRVHRRGLGNISPLRHREALYAGTWHQEQEDPRQHAPLDLWDKPDHRRESGRAPRGLDLEAPHREHAPPARTPPGGPLRNSPLEERFGYQGGPHRSESAQQEHVYRERQESPLLHGGSPYHEDLRGMAHMHVRRSPAEGRMNAYHMAGPDEASYDHPHRGQEWKAEVPRVPSGSFLDGRDTYVRSEPQYHSPQRHHPRARQQQPHQMRGDPNPYDRGGGAFFEQRGPGPQFEELRLQPTHELGFFDVASKGRDLNEPLQESVLLPRMGAEAEPRLLGKAGVPGVYASRDSGPRNPDLNQWGGRRTEGYFTGDLNQAHEAGPEGSLENEEGRKTPLNWL